MKNYLRSIVAVVLLFSATLSVNAQFEDHNVTKRFHMGFHGGLSVNSFRGSGTDILSPLTDFTGGISFDWQVGSEPLFIGFGINYLNEGYYCKEYLYTIWGENYDTYENFYGDRKKYDYSAVHVPLIVGYHINLASDLFISPYAGGFASYNFVRLHDDDFDDYWQSDRFNYGLRIGCGLNYGPLTLDLAYDLGLKNVFGNNYNDVKGYSGTFFATIGFNIVGSR